MLNKIDRVKQNIKAHSCLVKKKIVKIRKIHIVK